jgi:hypothetical protein
LPRPKIAAPVSQRDECSGSGLRGRKWKIGDRREDGWTCPTHSRPPLTLATPGARGWRRDSEAHPPRAAPQFDER